MPEKEFFCKKPHEQFHKEEKERGIHSIGLYVENEKVGEAKLRYFGNPIPTYYFYFFKIKDEFESKGYGSEIVGHINGFLKEKNRMGVLLNGIFEDDPKRDMYERKGWTRFKETGGLDWLYFNPPKWADKDLIEETLDRIYKNEPKKVE